MKFSGQGVLDQNRCGFGYAKSRPIGANGPKGIIDIGDGYKMARKMERVLRYVPLDFRISRLIGPHVVLVGHYRKERVCRFQTRDVEEGVQAWGGAVIDNLR